MRISGQLPSDMQTIDIQYYNSPAGELVLGSWCGKLCLCDWRRRVNRGAVDARIIRYTGARFVERPSEVTSLAIAEIEGYFSGQRQSFNVPLYMAGTPFQILVWEALMDVQYGHTESYLQLARRIHHPEAVRAVAASNAANPLVILVPCHRIIGKNGALTGYSGGTEAKRLLLSLERDHTKEMWLF